MRQGKYFELELDAASAEQARTLAAEVADKLLANPVIESYRIESNAAPAASSAATRTGTGLELVKLDS